MTSGGAAFRHEALLYSDDTTFVAGTVPFLRDAIAAGDPTYVVVSADKIRLLRSALGGSADDVVFADMAAIGRNPARIIPAWQQFVDKHQAPGHGVRGIGEPIWAGRSPAERVECRLHEALLNVAFGDTPGFWLLCPYDTTSLDDTVVHHARATHPYMQANGAHETRNAQYDRWTPHLLYEDPLPEPPADAAEMRFTTLAALRRFVAANADEIGLAPTAVADLVLAVDELATNSLCYGGGHGRLRMWPDDDWLLCEISDRGQITDPLAGRRAPERNRATGRGLWMVNQLCELVQIRTSYGGTTIRLHMSRRRGA